MALGAYSLSRLQTLQTNVRPIFESFLAQCEAAGIPCEIVQGTRSFAEQQAVYDQGRTTPGVIVTKAPPGDSYHNYGLAIDVVPVAYKNLPDWNPSGLLWNRIGAIGEGAGLTWGGNFSTPDKPHFQLTAAPIQELKAYWEKFKQIMPVEITPTDTALVSILIVLGIVWYFRPQLQRILNL